MGFKKIGIITPDITDGDVTHAPDVNSVFDALALKIDLTQKGATNGVATLDENKLVPTTQLPSYVDDVLEFATLSVFPVTGETGKIYVDLSNNRTYRWSGSVYIYITSGAVDSVAGKTGVVSLVKGDVGLSNVDNTTDVNKPISTLQQGALNLKAPIASPTFTGTVNGISKAMVGLSNVDNTADVNKPIVTTLVNGIMSSTDKVKLDAITGTNTGDYVHPTTDGNLHVPANSTTNGGKILTAGSSAGVYTWEAAAVVGLIRVNKTQLDTPYTITSSNCSGSIIFTNIGATSSVTMLLPVGADGYRVSAIVTAAFDYSFVANGSETIRYLSNVSKGGGLIKSSSIGDEIQLDWSGIQWVASINGSWQLETS